MKFLTIHLIAVGVCAAQQPVAPTPDTTASVRGENVAGYNLVDSFETGYRFATVGGNYAQYRSSVNFGNGIRLLSGFFSLNSKNGHGRFFDELVLSTQGLGNDPYESATLRIHKNRVYHYDLSWRRNDYFNPGLTTGGASDGHLLDTQYYMQDHDFTLFPDSKLKFFLGYTGSSQNGPALSTEQLFDSRGSVYPLFADVRRVRHEYRLGNEFQLLGVRVNWIHGWEDFKEDTPFTLSGIAAGIYAPPAASLTGFQRSEPYHGTAPYWRAGIFAGKSKYTAAGRFTYTAGQRGFVLDQTAIGLGRFGASQNQQIVTYGDAQRPAATGNLTISLAPTSRITIANSTAVYNIRTEGNSYFTQFDNGSQTVQTLNFNYLGIRTIANDTDLNYQALKWLGLDAGYHYSNRRISSNEQVTVDGSTFPTLAKQTNQLNAGSFGFRLRPLPRLSVLFSADIGRATLPFTPVADQNYHALDGRIQYKAKAFLLVASVKTNYNFNSALLSSYSSRSRNYSVNGSWNPRPWFGLDAQYSRLHLNTLGGIAYFANAQFIQGNSIYLSNIHSGILGARFVAGKRVDMYLAYSRVQDVGDGRGNPYGGSFLTSNAALPAFLAAQTFPVAFQSPFARVSVKINDKLRWNLGYQYYGYREEFYLTQGYRAHTGYSSLTWSF